MAREAKGPLAAALKDAQDAHGHINQQAAAAKIGVSPPNYSQWMAGKSYPSEEVLAKVAEFLGRSPDEVKALYPPDHRVRNARWKPSVDPATFDDFVTRIDGELGTLRRRVEALELRIPGPSVGPQFDQQLPEIGV